MKKIRVTYVMEDRIRKNSYENCTELYIADENAEEVIEESKKGWMTDLTIALNNLARLALNDEFARAYIEDVEVIK